MNRIYLFAFALIIGIAAQFPLYSDDINELIREDDPAHKQKREEWIRDMHRCEPGVDWRIIDEQTRISKYLLKQDEINKSGNNRLLNGAESIAGGKIKGEWIEKGSNNQAGRVMTADIDFDINFIYLISAGGNIWKGPLEGNNWTCLNNTQKFHGSLIRLLDIDDGSVPKQTKKRILVAESKSIMCSDDDGITWQTAKGTENIKNWGDVLRTVVLNDKNNTIYLISNEWDYQNWRSVSILYKSDDKGENFAKVMTYGSTQSRLDLWAPRYDGANAYLIHEDTLFTLDGSGIRPEFNICSWEPPDGKLSSAKAFILQGCFSENGNYLYLVMRTNSNPTEHFYFSLDMGKTWTKKGNLDFGPFTSNSFRVSTFDETLMFYGGVDLYYSINTGKDWKKINGWGEYYGDPATKLHADIPSVDIFRTPDGNEVYLISTDGGLYISDDYLSSVRNISLQSLNISQYYDILTSELKPEVVFAGAQAQGFQRCTSDSGKTLSFNQLISGDYGHLTSSDGGNTLWSVYPGFALIYTSAIGQYKQLSWKFKEENWMWMPHIIAVPDSPDMAYIAAGGDSGSYLWRLKIETNGINDQKLGFDFSSASEGGRLATIGISTFNTAYMYALTNNGRFFYSTDEGESWATNKDFAAPGSHYFYGGCIVPSNRQLGRLFIAGSGYNTHSVYVSNNHGKTFFPADSGLPKTLIYGLAQSDDEKLLFAATEVGPYVYIVEDSVWYDLSGLSAPDQLYWSVEYIPSKKTARFGTYGRGIWDFRIDELKTAINDTKPTITPKLSIEVSPVPFNGTLSITLSADRNSTASVKVFDLDGRLINTIYSGEIAAGTKAFSWNGKSSPGYDIPNGSYIIVFTAGGNSAYKKVVKE
jgi:hypothetical protein